MSIYIVRLSMSGPSGMTNPDCRRILCDDFFKVDNLALLFEGFDLIILDEWLRDALSPNDAREVLDFLDARYRRSSCLLATQFPVNQWHPQIQDPTLADAILDRLVHDSLRLALKGESMRKLTNPLKKDTDLIP